MIDVEEIQSFTRIIILSTELSIMQIVTIEPKKATRITFSLLSLLSN